MHFVRKTMDHWNIYQGAAVTDYRATFCACSASVLRYGATRNIQKEHLTLRISVFGQSVVRGSTTLDCSSKS